MKKGIIFTLDALLALAIFIAAVVGMYRFVSPTEPMDIISVNFYVEADNLLATSERILSNASCMYVGGSPEEAENYLEEAFQDFGRKFNLYLIILNETELKNFDYPINYRERANIKIENYEMNEFFIIRRYLVLTPFEETENGMIFPGTLYVNAPSSLLNKTVEYESPEGIESYAVLNRFYSDMNWEINETHFTTPEHILLDRYYVRVEEGSEFGMDEFYLFKYGIVIMEVEK